jgi:hypothetical protein
MMKKSTRPNIAELTRLKYKYRRLIMKGELRLPPRQAALLIGPDCAYHLYSVLPSDKQKGDGKKKRKDDE